MNHWRFWDTEPGHRKIRWWRETAREMAREAREWRGAMEDLDTYDGNAAICIREQFETTHRLRGILREAASILAKATETHRDYAGIEAVAALAHVAAQVIRLQDETIADRDTEIAELRAELEARAEVIASLQRSLESKRIALANKRAQVAALANKNADLQAVINRLRAGDELRAKGKP